MAFDLATNTGVAFGRADTDPVAQSYKLGDTGSSHGQRFVELSLVTRRLIKTFSPDHIVIEEAIAGGAPGDANRAKLAFGLRAMVMAEAFAVGLPVMEISVQSIRKHFLGQGNIPSHKAKPMTIARCELLGWRVSNDNEADACAAFACAAYRLTKSATPHPGGLFDHVIARAKSQNGARNAAKD